MPLIGQMFNLCCLFLGGQCNNISRRIIWGGISTGIWNYCENINMAYIWYVSPGLRALFFSYGRKCNCFPFILILPCSYSLEKINFLLTVKKKKCWFIISFWFNTTHYIKNKKNQGNIFFASTIRNRKVTLASKSHQFHCRQSSKSENLDSIFWS